MTPSRRPGAQGSRGLRSRIFFLRAADRRLKLEALLLLMLVRAVLACFPFGRVWGLHNRLRRIRPGAHAQAPDVQRRVAAAVWRASRFVPRATCLPQAMAAQILLARRGVPSSLRIGVAPGQTETPGEEVGTVGIDAHAWLESGGEVILGDGDLERFRSFPDFPGEPS